MSKLMTGSICVSDIPKEKIWTAKSGKRYVSIKMWINDDPDQYGNHASVQVAQSKDEIDQKLKAVYIGNLKNYQSDQKESPKANAKSSVNETAVEIEDDLPF